MERENRLIRWGGASLVVSALGFLAVFGLLSARFDYPDVLDQPAATVLPALLEGGSGLQAIWWTYALLPLLLLPASAAAGQALGHGAAGLMRLAGSFAVLAALTLTLGLIRWPSLNHELALRYAQAGAGDRAAIEMVFQGFNRYLGTYVGEQLGEIFLNGWFVMVGAGMLRTVRFPKWLGRAGIGVGVLGLVGMFRFATDAVAPVAGLNNVLLPAWLITCGVALWRYGPLPVSASDPAPTP